MDLRMTDRTAFPLADDEHSRKGNVGVPVGRPSAGRPPHISFSAVVILCLSPCISVCILYGDPWKISITWHCCNDFVMQGLACFDKKDGHQKRRFIDVIILPGDTYMSGQKKSEPPFSSTAFKLSAIRCQNDRTFP